MTIERLMEHCKKLEQENADLRAQLEQRVKLREELGRALTAWYENINHPQATGFMVAHSNEDLKTAYEAAKKAGAI